MKALCAECHRSNMDCVIWRDSGETVCIEKCKNIRKKRLLKKTGRLVCKCGDCPIHNEPHAPLEVEG